MSGRRKGKATDFHGDDVRFQKQCEPQPDEDSTSTESENGRVRRTNNFGDFVCVAQQQASGKFVASAKPVTEALIEEIAPAEAEKPEIHLTRDDEMQKKNTGEDIEEPSRLRAGKGDEEALLKRFEVVVQDFKEPSISPVELESNLQAQADEILALESIYGEDFESFDNENIGSKSFMISVHVEIPERFTLVADLQPLSESEISRELEDLNPLNGSPTESTRCSSKLNSKHYFNVDFLNPIQLIFTFPPSYPSHSPPLFVIYALWLNQSNVSKLCSALDKLWNDDKGQVVLYSWIDWLQNQTLSSLKISSQLELGPYGGGSTSFQGKGFDLRAVSGCHSFNSDIAGLLQYNEAQQSERFLSSLHMCSICFTEQSGKEFARLPCQHMFCWICMQTYASVHVNEGSVNKLNCPDTTCRGSIPPFLLKQLLDKDTFARWEKLVLQRSLDGMEDIVYCPRCERVCIEEADHFVQCAGCFFSFCSLCRNTWHVGTECVSPEARLSILQGRQTSGSGAEQRKKELQLINEFMNLQYVRREAKQCPRCKIAISKTEGCNKMACANCDQYFCFKCGKAITGYDHFKDGSCNLFDTQAGQYVPHQAIDHRQVQAQVELEFWPDRGRPCPNCRQLNVKNGNNNHIYCWACRSSYCCLCNKVVRRTSDHYGFGPTKCRQHTVD